MVHRVAVIGGDTDTLTTTSAGGIDVTKKEPIVFTSGTAICIRTVKWPQGSLVLWHDRKHGRHVH